jgi:hypothetical protein
MSTSAMIEARSLHDAQEFGRNGHTRKHAHLATTGVAGGDTADRGPDGAKNDASNLPRCCEALMTANRNLEHEPVRQHMPPDMPLTEDVGAFEMYEGAVEVASPHELSGERDFLLEHFPVPDVHTP